MMTDPNNSQKWEDPLREYEESSLPLPPEDWMEALVEHTLHAPRKQHAFSGNIGVAISLLLFLLINGSLILRLQAPGSGKQELRERTLQQLQNELLIPSSSVN